MGMIPGNVSAAIVGKESVLLVSGVLLSIIIGMIIGNVSTPESFTAASTPVSVAIGSLLLLLQAAAIPVPINTIA
jgi:hypothetical protein